MNRHHTYEEAVESVHVTREMGFQLNIEFIFGYPEQTLDIWIKDMEMAVSLPVEEIQLYRLKVIPYGDFTGTITKKFAMSDKDFLSVEMAFKMKQFAILFLAQNGYHENLRRVFSTKKKYFSHYAHNQCCELFDQIGLGLTAFHSLRDRFGLNTQYLKDYYSLIEQGKLPLNRGLVRSKEEQLRWHIILPLKNRDIIKSNYLERTGVPLNSVFQKKFEKLKGYDLIQEDEKIMKLTNRGTFFADEICQQFHHPDYMPYPKMAYASGDLNPYDDTAPF
jgi:oxygen-independent coproporphyrinogen-3 oxidase